MRRMQRSLLAAALVFAATIPGFLGSMPQRASAVDSASAPAVNAGAFHGQGHLAFIWANRLYVLDGKHNALHVLPGQNPSNPAWSADGTWLAYMALGAHGSDLWVARPDGGDARSIGRLPTAVQSYVWLPKGHALEIEVSGTMQTGPISWCVTPGGRPAEQCPARKFYGPVSPNGKMLAYLLLLPFKHPQDRREELFTVPMAGGNPKRRVPPLFGAIDLVGWWPDSNGLLYRVDPQFSSSLAADGSPLYTLKLGGTPRALPATLGYEDWIAFSPSRRQMVLVAGGGRQSWTNKALRLCDVETASCHALPSPRGTVSLDVDWAPRGNRLAFVRARDLGPVGGFKNSAALAAWIRSRTLWVSRADGSGARRLKAAGTGIYDPQWSGDGNHLLYVRDNALWLVDVRGGAPVRVLGPFLGTPSYFGFYGHPTWPVQWVWNRG